MDQRPRCKTGYYKTPRGKHRQNTDINCSNVFLDPSPRVMEIKIKINKWDLIKLTSFRTAKETIHKTKRQPTEWKKLFADKDTHKRLISKIYKQLIQLNNKKQPNQKMGRKP